MSELPFISVIVPTYNRPRQLVACVAALARLDYPRERWELVVVDDGSPVPLALPDLPYRVRLLRQANRGPAAARNSGAAVAYGTLLAFTDDDCAPHPGWLKALAAAHQAAPGALLGGPVHNALSKNLFAEASQELVSYLYAYYNAAGAPRFFTSNNIAVARDGFLAAGGFDVAYPRAAAEDRDFCDRWVRRGAPLVYLPDALVEHHHGLSLHSFWRQHSAYGQGARRFHLARARRGYEPVRVEPAAFYLNLLRYPLRRAPGPRGLLLAGLLGLAQAANLWGYLCEYLKPQHRLAAGSGIAGS